MEWNVGKGTNGTSVLIVIVMRLPEFGLCCLGGTEGNSMGLTLVLGRWFILFPLLFPYPLLSLLDPRHGV